MKAVLISIRPEWCQMIAALVKTLEIRTSRPKLETPFKCYVYQTGSGGVIGEFTCDKIERYPMMGYTGSRIIRYPVDSDFLRECCLSYEDIEIYAQGRIIYAWHISNYKIYARPMALSDFHNCEGCEYMGCCNTECWNRIRRAPQSWRYVEEIAG